MSENKESDKSSSRWFAIRTRRDFRAAEELKEECDEVFFPKNTVVSASGKKSERAAIPHVLFIKTTEDHALELEAEGRRHPESSIPLWIYRYPTDRRIQVIPESSIELLRLLTADDTTRCEIYNNKDFRANERVRVTGGRFAGYEGVVQRVRKNKHVIVQIEGICMVMLPFIHPDLLERV